MTKQEALDLLGMGFAVRRVIWPMDWSIKYDYQHETYTLFSRGAIMRFVFSESDNSAVDWERGGLL